MVRLACPLSALELWISNYDALTRPFTDESTFAVLHPSYPTSFDNPPLSSKRMIPGPS